MPASDPGKDFILRCGDHGASPWRGHVICEACNRVYQTERSDAAGYAPEVCECGRVLMDNNGDGTAMPLCTGCYVALSGRSPGSA